jgi:hypothetical protein
VRKKKKQCLPCFVTRGDKTSQDKMQDKVQEKQSDEKPNDASPPAEGGDDGWAAVLSPVLAVGGFLSSMVSSARPREDLSPEEPSKPASPVVKKKSSSLAQVSPTQTFLRLERSSSSLSNLKCSDAQVSPSQAPPKRKDRKNLKETSSSIVSLKCSDPPRRKDRKNLKEDIFVARQLEMLRCSQESPTQTSPKRKNRKTHKRREGGGEEEEEEHYARFLKSVVDKSERVGRVKEHRHRHRDRKRDDDREVSSQVSSSDQPEKSSHGKHNKKKAHRDDSKRSRGDSERRKRDDRETDSGQPKQSSNDTKKSAPNPTPSQVADAGQIVESSDVGTESWGQALTDLIIFGHNTKEAAVNTSKQVEDSARNADSSIGKTSTGEKYCLFLWCMILVFACC